MTYINKSKEPPCLTKLNSNPKNTYVDLQDECLEETRNQLKLDQKGLCAYCQRTFESIVFIEHHIPQSVSDEEQLRYSNFLGVCSGKYYLDRKSGKCVLFCSVSRGSKVLKFNPLIKKHIQSLSYDSDSRIISNDAIINKEINELLNLNFDDLCIDREISFENFFNNILRLAMVMKLSKLEALEKAKRSIMSNSNEFLGYILFRLDKLIIHHQN